MESLQQSAGVGMRPGLSNRCTLKFSNQLAGKYISATDFEINRFRNLRLGELVWHLSTQLNDSDLAA